MSEVEALLTSRVPPSKLYTVNVDAETLEIVNRVKEQTGRSRPKIVAAFVKEAYQVYLRKKRGRRTA